MNKRTPILEKFGDHAILLRFEDHISEKIRLEVMKWNAFISESLSEFIIETVPAYNSLAVFLKDDITVETFTGKLKAIDTISERYLTNKNRGIKIPVCYDLEFALDLEEMASEKNCEISEIITRHTQAHYRVCFLGFLPGFPYLEGLPEFLHTPRKSTPRQNIASGSVGIGGKQTGIYTMNSPGGWNIIGRTPLRFFSVTESPPALLQPGDSIQFVPINTSEFKNFDPDSYWKQIIQSTDKSGKEESDD